MVGWYTTGDEVERVLTAVGPDTDWRRVIADRFGWSTDDGPAPDGMISYGRVLFRPAPDTPAGPGDVTGVYLANNATEALAAHVGEIMPAATADGMEALLEALTVADELESAGLDGPARLAAARHRATFADLPGGTVWTLDAASPETAALLDRLNEAQTRLDRAADRVTGLRGRLFTDWYRYQFCAHPPLDDRDAYPDADPVAAFVRHGAAEVTEQDARAGRRAATVAALAAMLRAGLDDPDRLRAYPAPAATGSPRT